MPSAAESRMLNALIVSIAEHGMMPSAIAARMTLLGAPESLQGALASGLLGVGDTFVGPAANVGRMLQVEVAAYAGTFDERAEALVGAYAGRAARVPGLGHPHHPVDPRAERLLALQTELGLAGDHTAMMQAIHQAAIARRGRHLTLNAVGAVGDIGSDLGFEWHAIRGIGLVARSIGLVGHILEEMRSPAAGTIWDLVQEHTGYVGPRKCSSGQVR